MFTLNTEIYNVEQSIFSKRSLLQQKREDLERLQETSMKLENCREKFFDHHELCLEPELTIANFYGTRANYFDDFRRQELLPSYVAIYYGQINEVHEQISEKMETLQDEIASLEVHIESLEARHETLINQQNEEKKL